MSPAKPVFGWLVLLAALVGLIVSNHVVDALIPLKDSRATRATARQTTTAVQPESPVDLPAPGERPYDANAETSISTGRVCVDLSGGTFGWNWPNIPFGTAACDAARKTGK
jgi:hypothetical protein